MNPMWPRAVANGWHPVAPARALGPRPYAARLMGTPLVVFQGNSGPVVLTDRCPHRAAPLSTGRVKDGAIICPYHGWRFGETGACLHVPGSDALPPARAQTLPAVVRAGLVWTTLAQQPSPLPALPPELSNGALDGFWWAVPASRARLLDALENLLDPAHPHCIHPWIVRAPDRRRAVSVQVRLGPDGAEAVYEETGRTDALIPRLLEGRRLRSIGRYFPPTIGQVVFEGPGGPSLAITVVFCPEDQDRTRPFAHFATPKGLLPAWLKRLALIAVHKPVLRQDQRVLALQAENIARFDATHYVSGPLDYLGPAIWRLANGEPQPEEEYRATVHL